jgi:hypothetical protein
MADNSLWSDITNGASNVETDLLGPSYSYADNIPGPSALGVGSQGTFSQLGRNASAIGTYVKTMISGDPPLGNQFYVNTGGTCTAPDGSSRERFNYINNLSSGSADLPASISELGADFNGLLPGVVGDIEGLNPLYLFSSLSADSSPACECYKCNVTSGSPYQFISTTLSPDYSTANCTQVDISNCPPALTPTESFTNHSAIPVVVAGILLAILYFQGGK